MGAHWAGKYRSKRICLRDQKVCELIQGILSVPGIAGNEWVPARIGHFYNDTIFFS